MQKMIFFSHGEKGGVGKTAVASAAVEMLLAAGCKVAIVEGDIDNSDVAQRYESTVKHIKHVRLSDPSEYQRAVNDLAGFVSDLGDEADVIVVNMPANAATTVDRDIETLAAALEEIDVQVVTAISSGNTEQSVTRTLGIATRGLGSLGSTVVLAPEFLKDDSISGRLKALGLEMEVSVYPRLSPDTMQIILDHPRRTLTDLVSPSGPVKSPIQRIRISQYLRQAREVLMPLFNGRIPDSGKKGA